MGYHLPQFVVLLLSVVTLEGVPLGGGHNLLQTSSQPPELKVSHRVDAPQLNEKNETITTVQISLKGQESNLRAPISLSLVVDQSESLQNQDLQAIIQRTFANIGGALNEDDFLGISSFSFGAQERFGLTRFVNGSSSEFESVTAGLMPSGSTNLLEGVKSGINQQKSLNVIGQIVQGI
eukprot:TRINITY_DN2542_c1_g1_i1.p1 TRINITY_DN2542_c1_g1~~TRINITY_DN2542_c1_g1_i1.p1  ORF type:complete len:179 (+),score=10.94 TRINITY_DN2542_c1_g1_i1:138-674(+)